MTRSRSQGYGKLLLAEKSEKNQTKSEPYQHVQLLQKPRVPYTCKLEPISGRDRYLIKVLDYTVKFLPQQSPCTGNDLGKNVMMEKQ